MVWKQECSWHTWGGEREDRRERQPHFQVHVAKVGSQVIGTWGTDYLNRRLPFKFTAEVNQWAEHSVIDHAGGGAETKWRAGQAGCGALVPQLQASCCFASTRTGRSFQPWPRDTVNKDPRGTRMLLWGEGRSSFPFAPGSSLHFSTNGFSPQHSHASSRCWFHRTISLVLPEPDSHAHSMTPASASQHPSSGAQTPARENQHPLPPQQPCPQVSTFEQLSLFHVFASLGACSCSLQLLPPSYSQGPPLSSVLQRAWLVTIVTLDSHN